MEKDVAIAVARALKDAFGDYSRKRITAYHPDWAPGEEWAVKVEDPNWACTEYRTITNGLILSEVLNDLFVEVYHNS